jgi:hypothetical protein
MGKLVGQREDEHDEGVLIGRLDLQHVEADALGFAGLVQQAVALGFRECRGDGVLGDRLRLEHRSLLPCRA